MLTVVHWFPLHVPRGFQTPSQNSSALSLESSCLWTQAIFFPCFPPHPQAHSNSTHLGQLKESTLANHTRARARGCRVPSTHPLFHPLVCSQTIQNLSASRPSHQGSSSPPHPHAPGWEIHTSPAIFPPNLNNFSLSLLISIIPITCGQSFSLQSTWSRSLAAPCPCTGLVAQMHGPPGVWAVLGVPSHLQCAEVLHLFGQKKHDVLGCANISLWIQGSRAEGTMLVGMRWEKRPRDKKV